METFERTDIQEWPLRVPLFRRKAELFLGSNGLRLEETDVFLVALDAQERILAAGGLKGNLIKCVAVSDEARSSGLSAALISRLLAAGSQRGYTDFKVFTKPENQSIFESMGFRPIASAPKAILMENGRGLETYLRYLRAHPSDGVIVMNANPFTLGHRYLVEHASLSFRAEPQAKSRNLVVIPVREEASRFTYPERLAMLRAGCGDLADVVEGSDYQISASTFPTYFLKDLSDAAETQMRLDIDLFGRHIAPALGARVRFVGTEPADPLTARYNALMKELLPSYGIELIEIPRLTDAEGPLTATRVRSLLDGGRFKAASALTPASTHPFIRADLAVRALTMELEAPLKPGLVGPDSMGAHADMDETLMRKSIDILRPYFVRMASASSPEELRELGIRAEEAMLAATGGVNTHRGAICALGLVLCASADPLMEAENPRAVLQNNIVSIARAIFGEHSAVPSHGTEAVEKFGVRSARQMALEGYPELFASWLPYYDQVKDTAYGLQKTLLLIMSQLDDTCVIHRVGYARAQEVKAEAKALVEDFSVEKLREMNDRYSAERVSPGGSADMLALTVLAGSILLTI